METKNLTPLLSPQSIAVVGAAREKNKLGNIVVTKIQAGGYAGAVFPVNPHATDINGLKCFSDYNAIPTVPDLAIVVLPAELVCDVVRTIAQKGTKNLVVLSAGFKEMKGEGTAREEELKKIAREFSLNILGPNCLGFVNNSAKLNATFGEPAPTNGNVRFVLQSGALATSLFDWAKASNLGFNTCITLGNKAVLSENDFLAFWQTQKSEPLSPADEFNQPGLSRFRPIGLYLESIENGSEFLKIVQKLATKNPVFILKPGASNAAQAAMQSHTGAMANDDAVLTAALRDAGVIRCYGIEDFFDLTRAFSWENTPKGPKVAVVSNAGGPAVITTDVVAAEGLELATMSKNTHDLLAAALPRAANIHNPIDVLGDALADRYHAALEAVLAEKDVDAAIVILTPQVMTQIAATAEVIGELSQKYNKPILCSFMGGTLISEGEAVLNRFRIPSFRFPERAVKALSTMWRWQQFSSVHAKQTVSELKNKKIPAKALALLTPGTKVVPNTESQEFARRIGLKTPTGQTVTTDTSAKIAAKKLGYPVVLKISSTKLLHKTEAHGVIPNITSPQELATAFKQLQSRLKKIKDAKGTIELQKQITGGVEVIVGLKRDPSFGPTIVFGAGGTLAELMHDRCIQLLPLDKKSALELIAKSKIGKLLAGWRGAKPYALDKLAQLMVQLSQAFVATPAISEMEINPVIVTTKDAWAVDTKIMM